MHANERAALLADWLARIPAALLVGGCEGESEGRQAAFWDLRVPLSVPPGPRPGWSVNLGLSPFPSHSCCGREFIQGPDDDSTPRPAVQAEDGFSPKGTPGVPTWTPAGGRGPGMWGVQGKIWATGKGSPSGSVCAAQIVLNDFCCYSVLHLKTSMIRSSRELFIVENLKAAVMVGLRPKTTCYSEGA